MIATVTTRYFRGNLAETLASVAHGKERNIITKNGKDFVAIIPMEDFRLLMEIAEGIEDGDHH